MSKIFFFALLCLSTSGVFGQNESFIKYYDSVWSQTSKDSAMYYIEFSKEGTLYHCRSYWLATNKLNCKAVFADTLFKQPRGQLVRYYESGQIQDSIYYLENCEEKTSYRFYPNGKLWAHYSYNKNSGQKKSEGYDKEGNPIKDFIYFKDAEYPGGENGWINFLSKNLKSKVPIKNKAPVGTYEVNITFVVAKDGSLINIHPKTQYGYGMEEEAIRVIKKSPKWTPLVMLNEHHNAFRMQPVTFVVSN